MSQQQVQENSIQQQQQQPSKQQQYHKSGSVRHAEKRRIGTCPFADRIARISIQTYHERVPEKWREENKQVCLATIVAHTRSSRNPGDGNDDECGGNLQVLGMGVGTKFLSEKILQEEKQKHVLVGSINICTASTVSGNDIGTTIVDTHHPVFSSCYGMKIRDSHAEVLARRAFRRKIALEMKSHLLGQCVANPILTLRPTFKNDALETRPGNEKEETSKVIFSLAPGVTIHMYTSSAPCGNSCLKKFAKMSRERYDSSLGIDEWPVDAHEPIGGHSIHLGRFSLLVKKDNHASFSSTQQANTTDQSMKENNMSYRIPIKQQKWPANMNDQWCPPGTTLPHMGRGSIHTCSDKICRWNVIGLQGSLLSSLLHGPIYMETITIGRKFTKCIAQRAVCCRVDGGGTWKGIKRKRNEHKSQVETSNHEEFLNPSLYTVHHPTVMGTSVYMDDLGVLDMSGEKTIGQDVRFQSSLCWTWHPNHDDNVRFNAECINGETGLLHCDDDHVHEKDTKDKQMSLVCTYKLTQQYLDLARKVGKESTQLKLESCCENGKVCSTLNQLRDLKCKVASEYEHAKDELLHNHDVFYNWNRRDDSKRMKGTK